MAKNIKDLCDEFFKQLKRIRQTIRNENTSNVHGLGEKTQPGSRSLCHSCHLSHKQKRNSTAFIKTPDSQSHLEKKKCWMNQHTRLQAILQSYRNKISIALEQKQAVHQWERNGRLKYEYSHLISGKNVKSIL